MLFSLRPSLCQTSSLFVVMSGRSQSGLLWCTSLKYRRPPKVPTAYHRFDLVAVCGTRRGCLPASCCNVCIDRGRYPPQTAYEPQSLPSGSAQHQMCLAFSHRLSGFITAYARLPRISRPDVSVKAVWAFLTSWGLVCIASSFSLVSFFSALSTTCLAICMAQAGLHTFCIGLTGVKGTLHCLHFLAINIYPIVGAPSLQPRHELRRLFFAEPAGLETKLDDASAV